MRLTEHHRKLVDELSRYGIRPEIVTLGSGHVQLRWLAGNKRQALTTAMSPGDHRALKNELSRTRRMLREAGIKPNGTLPLACPPTPEAVTLSLEERVAQLERDVTMLLETLTAPATVAPVAPSVPVPVDTQPRAPDPPRKQTGKGRGGSWLWRVLRYDDYLTCSQVAQAGKRTVTSTGAQLSNWKQRGYVQHVRGLGWRKDRKVEEL